MYRNYRFDARKYNAERASLYARDRTIFKLVIQPPPMIKKTNVLDTNHLLIDT